MLYCSWRLYSLDQCYEYVFSGACDTHAKFLHERQRIGGTFEDYLKHLFDNFPLPNDMLYAAGDNSAGQLVATVGQRRPTKKLFVSRKEWNENAELAS